MKHIIAYPLWEAYRPAEIDPIQQEFIKRLVAKCQELGINLENTATERQKKNNTWIINLSIADTLKLILESGWQQYLTGILKSKTEKMIASPYFNIAKPGFVRSTKPNVGVAHWIISSGNLRQMISPYFGASAAQPSSQRNIIFSEVKGIEEVLGLFYSQLVLVIYNQLQRIKYALENGRDDTLSTYRFFDGASLTHLKSLMKKYVTIDWNKVFSSADFPQTTFTEIASDPDLPEELKRAVYSNPNWADTEKVEDILGDWE